MAGRAIVHTPSRKLEVPGQAGPHLHCLIPNFIKRKSPQERAANTTESEPQVNLRRRQVVKWIVRGLLAALATAVGYGAWVTFSVWMSFRSIDRVPVGFENVVQTLTTIPDSERPPVAVGAWPRGQVPPYDLSLAFSPAVPDDAFNTFLIVGTDSREDRDAVAQSDVILLVLLPSDGAAPIMLSLPRDLYLPNPCYGTLARINSGLNGCGEYANGPELLSLMVANFTGIRPDHFVLIGFEDFVRVVDALGGYNLCLEYPLRDDNARLPQGCNTLTGAGTLVWVRARTVEQLVNGEWEPVPGFNDLTRNQHQQDVLIAMLGKLRSFRSITSLANLADSLADAVTIDDQTSMADLIRLAWGMRNLDTATIDRLALPTNPLTTPDGERVRTPAESFAGVLAQVYPPK
jgi:LCP family protein required for cell wall assembly